MTFLVNQNNFFFKYNTVYWIFTIYTKCTMSKFKEGISPLHES